MAKQIIGIGASANDGSGDPLRIAFDKVNDNFNELYTNGSTNGTSLIDLFDSSGNLDLYSKPHKVSFLYNTKAEVDAVSATTYHGCIAHAVDTGAMWYTHGGSWRKLLSDNSAGNIGGYQDPLNLTSYKANVTNEDNSANTASLILKSVGDGTYTWAAESGGSGGSSPNTFGTIAISGTNIVADSATDTLNLVAGSNITLTANTSSDTITIAASGGGGSNSVNLNSVDAAVLNVATDTIAFIDADDSSNTKKETVADLITAIAGTGLSASSGVLSSTITQYANADVNAHLNTSSASNNEVLSWTGSDYDWVAAASGSTTLLGLSDVGSDGTNGQVLTTDGSGAFAFTTISGGGASRVSEAETTSSIADGASASVQYATLGKSFALQKVTVNKQCWVRIYSDTSARTADASRTQGTDPADGSGVIAEFISTGAGNTEFKVTPSIMGWLDDSETEVPVAIQNNSGSTGTVQVTIDALKLES